MNTTEEINEFVSGIESEVKNLVRDTLHEGLGDRLCDDFANELGLDHIKGTTWDSVWVVIWKTVIEVAKEELNSLEPTSAQENIYRDLKLQEEKEQEEQKEVSLEAAQKLTKALKDLIGPMAAKFSEEELKTFRNALKDMPGFNF